MSAAARAAVCSSSILGRILRPSPIASASEFAKVTAGQFHHNYSSSSSEEQIYMDALLVQHNKKKKKFFIKFDDVEDAILEYAEIRPRVLDLYHTGVPASLQGKGVAKKLAQEAFEYVVYHDYSMKLSCSYLQKFLQQNPKPEYIERVVEE